MTPGASPPRVAQPPRPQGAPNTCSCLRSLVLGKRQELQLQLFSGSHSSKVTLALKASSSRGDRDWNLLKWQPLLVMVGLEVGIGPALAKPSTMDPSAAMTEAQLLPWPRSSVPTDVCKVKRRMEIGISTGTDKACVGGAR
ncbi:hypothetical protein mRhiFer1_009259 [Rhinolophus ferrumequinum]|uniref:Uncharacterized protein n=1 Tax=Rhinolophus ferrumequinum TaxID=59479 RepID=A0A7J7S7U1_RHIFE|nr:hypothetical protein mRhiFer1_009259 [Rhinolophus ferrumequinum]